MCPRLRRIRCCRGVGDVARRAVAAVAEDDFEDVVEDDVEDGIEDDGVEHEEEHVENWAAVEALQARVDTSADTEQCTQFISSISADCGPLDTT